MIIKIVNSTWIKYISRVFLFLLVVSVLYAAGSYGYVRKHLRAIERLTPPVTVTPPTTWRPGVFSYIHQTNERQRMLTKSKRYNGFEIDTYTLPEKREIYVAHDQRQFKHKMTLQAAFSIPKDPKQTFFWIDMKTALTQQQIDDVKEIARVIGVPLENLIFEPPYNDDKQAKLLVENGLNVMLFVTGFYKENLTAQQTQQLVQKIQQQIEDIKPNED